MKNYYEILEVNPKASEDIIKKVYKIKVKQNHPDLFQGEEKKKAEEKTKEITEAYDILSNKEKRQNYDLELKNNENEEKDKYIKYESIISSLKSENEYLKNVIISKNNIINEFLENESDPYKQSPNTYYKQNEKNEHKSNLQSNNSQNYFYSILYDLKQLILKLAIFIIIIILLLLIFWTLTGNNIFKIIFK